MAEIIIVPVLKDNYSYLIHDELGGMTAVIDPSESRPILEILELREWRLDYVINTHHHWDHTGGNLELKQSSGAKIIGYQGDAHRIPGIDIQWNDQQTYSLGTLSFKIMHIPGHTTGHILVYVPQLEAAFCGDALFSLGCGRLFEGTAEQMLKSLKKISALPETTKLYCGHEYTLVNGAFALSIEPNNADLLEYLRHCQQLRNEGLPTIPTTVGVEKKLNPFLRAASLEMRKGLGMEDGSEQEVFAALRAHKDHFKMPIQ